MQVTDRALFCSIEKASEIVFRDWAEMQNFVWQYAFCQISAIFQKNRVQVYFSIASKKTSIDQQSTGGSLTVN